MIRSPSFWTSITSVLANKLRSLLIIGVRERRTKCSPRQGKNCHKSGRRGNKSEKWGKREEKSGNTSVVGTMRALCNCRMHCSSCYSSSDPQRYSELAAWVVLCYMRPKYLDVLPGILFVLLINSTNICLLFFQSLPSPFYNERLCRYFWKTHLQCKFLGPFSCQTDVFSLKQTKQCCFIIIYWTPAIEN